MRFWSFVSALFLGFLLLWPSGALRAEQALGAYSVTAGRLNVRSGPAGHFDVVGQVYAGDKVEVTLWLEDWARISEEDAPSQWVSGRFIKPYQAGAAGKTPEVEAPEPAETPEAEKVEEPESAQEPEETQESESEAVAETPADPLDEQQAAKPVPPRSATSEEEESPPSVESGAPTAEAEAAPEPSPEPSPETTAESLAEASEPAASVASQTQPQTQAQAETPPPPQLLPIPAKADYDFLGMTLGLSLLEFVEIDNGTSALGYDRRLVCSNAPQAAAGLPPPEAPAESSAAGLITCDHAFIPRSVEAGEPFYSQIDWHGITLFPYYRFLADSPVLEAAGEHYLMSMFFLADARDFGFLGNLMFDLYGEPDQRQKQILDDGAGGTLTSNEWTWTKGQTVILLSQYWSDNQTLGLEFTHVPLAEAYLQRLEATPRP